MHHKQPISSEFSFVYFIPLHNRLSVHNLSSHTRHLCRRQILITCCAKRPYDDHYIVRQDSSSVDNSTHTHNRQHSSLESPYLVGLDLVKQDLERLRAFFVRLVDHRVATPSTISENETLLDEHREHPNDMITNSSDNGSPNSIPPSPQATLQSNNVGQDSESHSKSSSRKGGGSYEPRSTTGQVVAEQFSGMRGAFERAMTSARFRVADAIRTALLTTVTVTVAMRGVAVQLLGGSTVKLRLRRQQKFGAKQPQPNWPLSSSFRWQAFNVIRKSSHIDETSRLTYQRRTRVSTIRRTVQSRNNARRTAAFVSGLTRIADVVIPSTWRTATAALPPGKRGGALAVLSVGAAIILSSGAPVAGMVSGISIALTSYAVIGARASVTNKRAFHSLVDIPINWPNSASIRAVHTPISQRISRAQERRLWKQRKVLERKSSYTKTNDQPVAGVLDSSKAMTLKSSVNINRQSVFAPNNNKKPARQFFGVDKDKMHAVYDAVDDENDRTEQSIETAAYVIREAQPWLLSLPVVGIALSLLDFIVYNLEQISGRILRRLGLKIERNVAKNDGWLLLSSLNQIDG